MPNPTEAAPSTQEIRARLESQGLLGPSGLARNPFWLGLILRTRIFDQRNRAALLHSATTELLRREWAKPDAKRSWKKVEEADDQIRHTIECLGWLAYKMTSTALVAIDLDTAKSLVDEYIKQKLPPGTIDSAGVLAFGRDALLIEYSTSKTVSVKRELSFRHKLLQDSLAAIVIHSDSSLLSPAVIASASHETLWWPVLLMLNDLYESDGWLAAHKNHESLIRSLMALPANSMGLMLSNALIWSVDDVIQKDLVDTVHGPLFATLQTNTDPTLAHAASRLSAISPESLVRVLEPMTKVQDLRQPLTTFLKSVTEAGVEDRAADLLIFHLFDNPYLREIATEAFKELGQAGAESIVRVLQQRPSWGAVETLGALRTPAGTEALLKALPDADEFLQGQILEALGNIGDPRAVDAVTEFASKPDFLLSGLAIQALGRLGSHAIEPLVQLARKNEAAPGLIELAFVSIGEPVVPRLIDALEDDSSALRVVAADVLGRLNTPAAVQPLAKRMNDKDTMVAIMAVAALTHFGGLAVPPLLEYIETTPSTEFLYHSVVDALGKLGGDAVPALLQATTQKDPKIRGAAAKALGRIGDSAALNRLTELLGSDENTDVRASAAEAMASIKDPNAIPFLSNALTDPEPLVRIQVIGALARFGSKEALKWLIGTLDQGLDGLTEEQNQGVRYLVGKSLADMRNLDAIPILQRLAAEFENRSNLKAAEYAKWYRELIVQIEG